MAAGTAPSKVIERNAQLEAELLAMQATIRQMAIQLQAMQQGNGSAAAGPTWAPAAAGAGGGGTASAAAAQAYLAGERAAAEAFTGQPVLALGDSEEPPGQGSKRFRADDGGATTGETQIDASMALSEVPAGQPDPPTQAASAAEVLASAKAAAESAAASLLQQG